MQNRVIGNIDGRQIKSYTLSDGNISVDVMTYGATITSIKTTQKDGKIVDVVLGYKSLEDYLKYDNYFGATIGRVCNRISGAKFALNGKEYLLAENRPNNSLHGGLIGFDKRIWQDTVKDEVLYLSYCSPDGEEGYPSNLWVTVAFSVKNGAINIEYTATCEGDTPVNLTNHAFFNLSGESSGDILDTVIFVDADSITFNDATTDVNGGFKNILGTVFDFNKPKTFSQDINAKDDILIDCLGYDVNYVLKGNGFRRVAYALSKKSGVKLEVYTDAVGMQLYSGNYLQGDIGKSGTVYKKNYGFCMETQNHPDAINRSNYPSCVLKKGQTYKTVTSYKFSVEK